MMNGLLVESIVEAVVHIAMRSWYKPFSSAVTFIFAPLGKHLDATILIEAEQLVMRRPCRALLNFF